MSEPTTVIELADGRQLACDDVGDPGGHPIVYLHGTPDSRLARHPDDGLAAFLGVRLVAVDRPGFGHSTAHRAGTVGSLAADVEALIDHLGIGRFSVLGWSAGALSAASVAARLGDRVSRIGIAAGLPPVTAFADATVLAAADGARTVMVELAEELGPEGAAAEMAPYLVPLPINLDLARQHLLEGADALRRAELDAVPGAVEVMAEAMADAVRSGLDGVTHDLVLHLTPPDLDLAAITAPTDLWYGELDTTAPPAFGRWYAAHIPEATLHELAGAGHAFPFARWAELLTFLR